MERTNVGTVSMDLILDSNKFDNSVKNKTKSTENAFSTSMRKIGTFVASAFAVGTIVNFGKKAVDAASEVQSAWTGLNSIVQGTGNSFAVAQKFISDYTKDGLTTITEATTAYKNLLSRGYDTSQIENTMIALKDSAAFGRQASYDLGEAIVTATEGLKNENSILVDNAGVTKNVAKMWEDWAKAHGTTTSAMTQAQKIEAEYNGILEETKFQVGDALTYTKTFGGQIQQLTASFTNMKIAVGKVVTPIAQLFIPVINNAINAITNLFNSLQKIMGMFGLKFNDVVIKSSSSIVGIGENSQKSAKEAVSAAKKINKAFANIDEVNVLKTQKSDSSDSGSGSTPKIDSSSLVDSVASSTSAFDNLTSKFKELQSLFLTGFKLTFDFNLLDSIKTSFDNIKISVKGIFSSKDVQKSVSRWGKTLTFNLGKITGSVGKIGSSIADGLIGNIDIYLSQNSGRIQKFISNMFNINANDINLIGDFSQVLADISTLFQSDTAKQIGVNIISMFTNPMMSVTTTLAQFGYDVTNLLLSPIIDNTESIKVAFENMLNPINTMTSTLSSAFTFIGDSVSNLYTVHLSPFFENLKTGLSDTFGKFLDIYNTYIYPFVDNITKDISNLWDTYLKPFFDNVMGIVGSIIDVIGILWNNSLKPLIDWLVQNVVPIIVPILSQVWNAVSTVYKSIMNAINTVMSILRGLIDFILGVFTGDWERAWDGIKTIFTGIFDGIKNAATIGIDFIRNIITNSLTQTKNVISGILNTIKTNFENAFNNIKTTITNVWNGILNLFSKGGQIFNGVTDGISGAFKSIVNTLISGINKVIKTPFDGINGALKKIKNIDIFGAKPFSKLINTISIPKIPMLANGGWVAKNNPQLTIIGDNTREGEIVSPESKIYEQTDKAIKDNKAYQREEAKELHIILEVRYEDGKKIIKKINQEQIEAGEILLLV